MINGGELCKFDGKDFIYYPLKNDILSNWKNVDLTELESGEIMLRSSEYAKFNPKSETFKYYSDPPIEAQQVIDEKTGDVKGLLPPNQAAFDKYGNVWYANYHGVFKLFEDTCINLFNSDPEGQDLHFYWRNSFIDNAGHFWAKSTNEDLYRFSDSGYVKINLINEFENIEGDPIIKYVDEDDNIIFINGSKISNGRGDKLSLDNKLYSYSSEDKLLTVLDLPAITDVGMIEKKGSKLFIIDNYDPFSNRLIIYDIVTNTYDISRNQNYFENFVSSSNNEIILFNKVYQNGINRESTFVEIRREEYKDPIRLLIDRQSINKVLYDKENNIWISSNTGLTKFSSSKIEFKAKELFEDYNLNWGNAVIDGSGNVWFTTGSNVYDEFGEVIDSEPKNLKRYDVAENTIEDILTLDEFGGQLNPVYNGLLDTFWIKTSREELSFFLLNDTMIVSGDDVSFIDFSIDEPLGDYRNIKRNDSIIYYDDDPSKKLELKGYNVSSKESLSLLSLDSVGFIINVIKSSSNKYWMFSFKKQMVYCFDSEQVVIKPEAYPNSGARNYDPMPVADIYGNIWIASNMGLVKLSLDNDSITSNLLSKSNGLSSTLINDLYIDDKQFLWVATSNGVDVLDLDEYFDTGLAKFEHFGRKEGLLDLNCENFEVRGNTIYVCTPKGFALIDLNKKVNSGIAPTPFFISIGFPLEDSYFEKSILNNDSVFEFANPFSTIYFKFNSIKYNYSSALEYNSILYKDDKLLYGSFEDINWNIQEDIKYEGLEPGKYTIELYSRIGKSGELSEAVRFSFEILPAWWQTKLFLIFVIFCVLLGVYLLFRLRTRTLLKKQEMLEVEISNATHEIREQRDEIVDSINYAKRIQSAILPPDKIVKEYLNDSFILYKPKDIVAGDFYWMEPAGEKIIFAAADCTGHGVPGAMVSVVCNNALNRSVREYGLTDPGKILDKTREIVIEEFEKGEEEVMDGMDIAICSLQGNSLKYAGAHNPLWIVRDSKIIETKANKQPVGKYDDLKPYVTHSFDLVKGDTIYIFSDGYVDQFGGEKGKKFKAKAFRELLLSIQDKPMAEQRLLIDTTFIDWKGDLEQIDDVCVMGVRI